MESKIKHMTIEAELPTGMPIGDLSRKYPETTFNITNGHWIKKDERILYITSKDWNEEHYKTLKKHKAIIHLEKIGNIVMIHIKSNRLKSLE